MTGDPAVREALGRLRGSAFSAPVRLAAGILLLARGPMEFGELRSALGVTPGSLWSHLQRLEERGLVELRRRLTVKGPRVVVALTEEGREELLSYLEALEELTRRAAGREGKRGEGG